MVFCSATPAVEFTVGIDGEAGVDAFADGLEFDFGIDGEGDVCRSFGTAELAVFITAAREDGSAF